MAKHMLRAVPLFCLFVSLAGCGSDRPKTVPISGVVTFDGQPPPATGGLFFACREPAPGYDRRSGRATFGTDGKFEVTSWDEGDGLVPGTYVVRVECYKEPPMMGVPVASYVADSFQPAELVVEEGQGRIDNWNLDVPLAKD